MSAATADRLYSVEAALANTIEKLDAITELANASGSAIVAIGARLAKVEAALANTIEKLDALTERVRRLEQGAPR